MKTSSFFEDEEDLTSFDDEEEVDDEEAGEEYIPQDDKPPEIKPSKPPGFVKPSLKELVEFQADLLRQIKAKKNQQKQTPKKILPVQLFIKSF